MSVTEYKVPSPGESVTEVVIARWLRANGDYIEKDEEICELDSDKATLSIQAEKPGALKIIHPEGATVKVGEIICTIDSSVPAPEGKPVAEKKITDKEKTENKIPNPLPAKVETTSHASGYPSPAAQKLMREKNLDAGSITASGKDGRILLQDVQDALVNGFNGKKSNAPLSREQENKKLTTLRKKIAHRLVKVKNETAMLTTFNEVDMKPVMDLRKKYKDKFAEVHGVGLGFMSFFTKACSIALEQYPAVNAFFADEEIIINHYTDIGIAVSTPKGLMVPVLRNVENLSLAQIEKGIKDMATRARDGKITVDEMNGGTFTITNGGVFGSMLSTPIINPPQSAILGMHTIVERPVAINGKVEIRPIMYVALSYDHRIIDGKESVSFLVKVKEMIENPVKMLFAGKEPEAVVLGV